MHLVTLFKELTKIDPNLLRLIGDKSQWPQEWTKIIIKRYERFPSISLTDDLLPIDSSLAQTLNRRTSSRNPTKNNITLQELATLLYYSAGIKGGVRRYSNDTPSSEFDQSRRFYPSGGARYPLEIYVGIRSHPELSPALYHYNVMDHSLEKLFSGEEMSKSLQTIDATYTWTKEVNAFIFISANFKRSSIKYDTMAYNLTLTEVGHLAQNIFLTGTALNMKSCHLTQTSDVIKHIYDIDSEEVFITMIPVFR